MVDEKPRVLIVDDEQSICDLLYDELSEQGYTCTAVLDGNEATSKLVAENFDVVLLDIKLGSISGMEVLKEIRSNHHDTATIMITGINHLDTAVEAMKLGASDYIVKPFELDRLNNSLRTVWEAKKHSPERRDKPNNKEPFNRMNAIARGVEAKLDSVDNHTKIVTERTIDVARQLGVPEKEIKGWAAARARQDAERDRVIKSSLDKLKLSPIAQYMIGVTELHQYIPDFSEPQN
jgi:DNA-binding NtrC family response regulator